MPRFVVNVMTGQVEQFPDLPAAQSNPPALSQFEKDKARFKARAAVKDDLIAYMAADNTRRLRDGSWSVDALTDLLQDQELSLVMGFMNTLAFESAAEVLAASSHPLLTPEIKADWISRLQAHYYNEGTA